MQDHESEDEPEVDHDHRDGTVGVQEAVLSAWESPQDREHEEYSEVTRVVKFKDPTPEPNPSTHADDDEEQAMNSQEEAEDLDRYENILVTLE